MKIPLHMLPEVQFQVLAAMDSIKVKLYSWRAYAL